MKPRTPPEPPIADRVTAWAQMQNGSSRWAGHCYRYVRDAFHAAGLSLPMAPSAADAARWYRARGQMKSDGAPPRGAVIFYDNKTTARGHVGISLGSGAIVHAIGSVVVSNNYRSLPGGANLTLIGYVTAPLGS